MAGSSLTATNHGRPVLAVGADFYTAGDIIDAAQFRGEVQPAWEKFLRVLACEEHADDEEREADEAAIDAAVQTFRYDHDLITAEETEGWLAARGLTLSDFSDYFSRHYWADMFNDAITEPAIDYLSASAELRDLFLAELFLSGELMRMATRLGWRLAAVASSETTPSPEQIEAQRRQLMERLAPVRLPDWLAQMGRDDAWIEQMSLLEATFQAVREEVLSPQARKREVATLRLQLTLFEIEVLEVDSLDAAREALLCAREDGMTLEEIANEGRYPFRHEQLVMDDIAPEIQQQFLSVTAGKLLEPMEIDGAHRLYRVVAKQEPDPEDPAVRRRVDQRLLDRHFADAMAQHVRWELPAE